MRARLRFVFALGVAMGLAVASSGAMAAPRPGSELSLFLRLNGTPERYALADGGMSGLYSTGSAVCMPVSGNDVLKVECTAAVYLCAKSADAGCNSTATSTHRGGYLGANASTYIVVDSTVTSLMCMVPASGSADCPVWQMR